jgi:hypothetical protein
MARPTDSLSGQTTSSDAASAAQLHLKSAGIREEVNCHVLACLLVVPAVNHL